VEGWVLSVMGRVQVRREGQVVPVSRKALTLLARLTLDGQPMHRESAAAFLWRGTGGLQNLRVELSNLRRAGLTLAPAGAPLLRSPLTTDLSHWENDFTQDPGPWLDTLATGPLAGLDDPDNPELSAWLSQERAALHERLQRAAQSSLHEHASDPTATRLRQVAAQLGWHLPVTPATPLPGLDSLLRRAAAEPQVLLYSGRVGSGRTERLCLSLREAGWLPLPLSTVRSPAHLLASLIMQLRAHLPRAAQVQADTLLAHVSDPELDMVRLCPLLLQLKRPVAFVLRSAEALHPDTARLLTFLLNWPAPILLALVTTPFARPGVQQLLEGHGGTRRVTTLEHPAVTLADVRAMLPASMTDPARTATALEILRQSEGWRPAAEALAVMPVPSTRRVRLNADLRADLLSELQGAVPDPADLGALARLAVLPAPFGTALATQTLTSSGHTDAQAALLLRAARRTGLIESVPECVVIDLGQPGPRRLPDDDHPLAFTSELQRVVLAGLLDPAERRQLRGLPSTPRADRPQGVPLIAARVLGEPAQATGPVRQLGGGYQLLEGDGTLTLLRFGAPEHGATQVRLRYPVPCASEPVWHWSLTARVLVVEPGQGNAMPLALRVHPAGQSAPEVLKPALPATPGQWVAFSGYGQGSTLEFLCAATNIIIQVAQIRLVPAADAWLRSQQAAQGSAAS
jgi:hypothetical protein